MSDTSSTIHVPVGTKGTSYPHVGYMGRPNFGFQFYSVIEGIPTKILKEQISNQDKQLMLL